MMINWRIIIDHLTTNQVIGIILVIWSIWFIIDGIIENKRLSKNHK